MLSKQSGWAEQNPEDWWENTKLAVLETLQKSGVSGSQVQAIGISYQMHGLVLLDKNGQCLRPSIIWCDSRAVQIGEQAFLDLGKDYCLSHYLNSPGNFTASKMRWVIENEKDILSKTAHLLLPGDYIAYKLSGEFSTTISGLSEGIFWDFIDKKPANQLLKKYDIPSSLLPDVKSTFSIQAQLSAMVAKELGLKARIPISYRAGDQPNNAFSLKVLNPGEVAATAGTSGVVYGITDQLRFDTQSRVNTFAHVNYTPEINRLGVLLCVNGTGILNSWTKNQLLGQNSSISYSLMNELASEAPIGSDGLMVLPFGNGAERILGNKNIGASFHNLEFNRHQIGHILRAVQEGIVFSLVYGLEIMNDTGVTAGTIRAGNANMFLSPLFRNAFATLSGASIELINTDGAQGAARGAGLGCGIYKSEKECFIGLERMLTIEPDIKEQQAYQEAYLRWKSLLPEI